MLTGATASVNYKRSIQVGSKGFEESGRGWKIIFLADDCRERIGATTVMLKVGAPQLWQVEPYSIPSSFVRCRFLCFDD